MRKILIIAWKEIYLTFTNRNLLIIMILSPLAVATIVGLAFGGSGANDIPIRDIPVAIVNQDQGNDFGLNYGDIFVSLLVPAEGQGLVPTQGEGTCDLLESRSSGRRDSNVLHDLTDSVVFDAAVANALIESGELDPPVHDTTEENYVELVAKLAVKNGTYVAAIIIPPNFTQRIAYIPVIHPSIEQSGITVYANSGSPISSGVIRSIAGGITQRIAAGNIAMAATFGELQERYGAAALSTFSQDDFSSAFACAFDPGTDLVQLQSESVRGGASDDTTSIILVAVGSAQAMFFAMFTAQFGVLSMHQERREWTLQRLVISPTPRSHILAGKLLGVFVTVIFQLLVLIVALTLIASLLQRELTLIWGDDFLSLGLLVFAAALGVAGFGMLLAGIVRTAEQGQVVGPVANMVQGVLGGAFGFLLPTSVAVFSLVYWGRQAFLSLSRGDSDIGLNLLVLVVLGLIMYVLGVILFNRRFDF
ncbi:MAG: ABC transporter permease [Chloroflexi bacterium]|nr:ABC transporter permease [Chloroflexota bacterium]